MINERTELINIIKDVCREEIHNCKSHYDPYFDDEVYDDINEVNAILRVNKRLCSIIRDISFSFKDINSCDGCRFFEGSDESFPCNRCVRREKDYYDCIV